jgi:two-component system response regulator HupR/HoxA
VLITGETGVGKEHIAEILHSSSNRREGPFVAVNCAAIPSELLEAELFGIESGVATGVSARKGKFQLARGGVLFLDEIGDMSLELQSKLLRAIQALEVHPLGARAPEPIDVRIITATNTDLQALIAAGRFRRDLYYRVAGFTVHVPPLRARRDDIPAFTEYFMRLYSEEIGKPVRGMTVKALSCLAAAPWAGNVRELEHEVRRLVYLCPENQVIDSSMLSPSILLPPLELQLQELGIDGDLNLEAAIGLVEERLINAALAKTKGNRSRAAKLLGISRNGLALKMDRLGFNR